MSLYGYLRGFVDAVGEELNHLAGFEMTRLTADLLAAPFGTSPAGSATASVESTYGWPNSGVVYVGGERIPYSGRTATTLTGLERDPTVREPHRKGDTVVLWTRDRSAVEKARLSLFVDHASGAFLDVIGRNYGVPRYLGADDDDYRALIKTLAYQAGKGRRKSLNELLAILLSDQYHTGAAVDVDGPANQLKASSAAFSPDAVDYLVRVKGTGANDRLCRIKSVSGTHMEANLDPQGSPWWQSAEPLVDEQGVDWEILPWRIIETPYKRNTVLVRLGLAAPESPSGYAYLQGGEEGTVVNLGTVEVDHNIRQVLGVWLDRTRAGTNYADQNNFSGKQITLDSQLPGGTTSVIVDYGAVEEPSSPTTGIPGGAGGVASAQLLADVNERNPGDPPQTRYPLYLGDRVGLIRRILDLLTVAGVIPELEVETLEAP